MRRMFLLCLALSASASATGCAGGQRVVLVPPETWVKDSTGKEVPTGFVKIGPSVKGRVYVSDGKGGWELSENAVSLPEGWLCLPPPPTEDKE